MLACPCKVARVETQRAVFRIPAAYSDGVDTLGAQLRARGLAAELEFSLLAVVRALGTRVRAFVSGAAGYTCTLSFSFR